MEERLFKIETLSFCLPEGFKELTPNEVKALYQTDIEEFFVIKDDKRDLTMTILYQEYPRLLVMISKIDEIVTKHSAVSEEMYADNEYNLIKFDKRVINKQILSGYIFTYVKEEIPYQVLTLIMKHKTYVFTINCYKKLDDNMGFEEFDEILNSLSFKK